MNTAQGYEDGERVPVTVPLADSPALELVEILRQYGAEFPDLGMAVEAIDDALDAAARPATITAAPALAAAANAILGPILEGDPTPAQAGVRAYTLANILSVRPHRTQRVLAAELGVSPGTVGEAASRLAIIKRR